MNDLFEKGWFSFKHPIDSIKGLFWGLKYERERSKRGFSEYDVYDVDYYLEYLLPDLLEAYLKKLDEIDSFPILFMEEYYNEHKDEIGCTFQEFRCYTPDLRDWHKKMEEECRRRWREIIDEMVFLFRESCKSTSSRPDPDPCMNSDEWNDLYDKNRAYRSSCRKQAFGLLAEWFEYLWI